jgi:3-oxoacyl-[acyl-carrier-protein] synthase II
MTSTHNHEPRVLVTGIGLETGLSFHDPEASWKAMREGRHSFRVLNPWVKATPPHVGSPTAVPDLNGLSTTLIAVQDAGLWGFAEHRMVGVDPERVASVIGLSKGNVRSLGATATYVEEDRVWRSRKPTAMAEAFRSRRVRRLYAGSGFDWPESWPYGTCSSINRLFEVRGPSFVPVAACATGLIAAIRGADLIRSGSCDVALVGATDESIHALILGAFRKMGVLAHVGEGDDPGRAVRPWDRKRSGFLVGEGAAVLVLEREDHARAAGVLPYCEFAGGAFGSDAYHMTALNPDPSNLAGLIGRALDAAGVDASEIDHVNVHGTATETNDPLECQALRMALGPHADGVSCSANKAQIGHCLGAAGAVELAFACLAVRDQFVPPTLNLHDPDPRCDLDGTPHVGRARRIRAALKLSIGFGGHLAAAVLRQAEAPRRAPSHADP